jgi:hypothetical protein
MYYNLIMKTLGYDPLLDFPALPGSVVATCPLRESQVDLRSGLSFLFLQAIWNTRGTGPINSYGGTIQCIVEVITLPNLTASQHIGCLVLGPSTKHGPIFFNFSVYTIPNFNIYIMLVASVAC